MEDERTLEELRADYILLKEENDKLKSDFVVESDKVKSLDERILKLQEHNQALFLKATEKIETEETEEEEEETSTAKLTAEKVVADYLKGMI